MYGRRDSIVDVVRESFSDLACDDVRVGSDDVNAASDDVSVGADDTSVGSVTFGPTFQLALAGAVVHFISAIVFSMASIFQDSVMTQRPRGLRPLTKIFARAPPLDYGAQKSVVMSSAGAEGGKGFDASSKRFSTSMWKDSTTLSMFNLHDTKG